MDNRNQLYREKRRLQAAKHCCVCVCLKKAPNLLRTSLQVFGPAWMCMKEVLKKCHVQNLCHDTQMRFDIYPLPDSELILLFSFSIWNM